MDRGEIFHNNRNYTAPRVSWQFANGRPVPDGMEVCHTCDNPNCVTPAHLWIGTHRENMHDASVKGRIASAAKTHCLRGHPFSGDNLVQRPGWRGCRTCRNARKRAVTARKKAEQAAEARSA